MTALVAAVIAGFTSLVVMAVTQLITVRKDEIKFRREKAEELSKRLFELIDELYKVTDNGTDLLTKDRETALRIRAQAQVLPRKTVAIGLLLRLYFPTLKQFWEPHAKSCEDLARLVDGCVGDGDATWWGSFSTSVHKVFGTHDALIDAITVFYPELTRDWPHFLFCWDDCCRR